MASAFSAPVTAFQVGNYFVRQYYHVLQQQPDYSHQFYNDASTMLRIDGDTIETATAMLQIHSLVMSLNFTRIEIKSAHSMDSWSGGILVTVSGSTQFKDLKVRRKFLQTFFLAPQEKGYFVLNDIFQFVAEEPVPVHPPSLLMHADVDSQHSVSNSSLQEPVADYVLAGEVEPSEFVQETHPDETTTTEEYALPEQQRLPESNDIAEESFDDYGSTPYPAVDNAVQELEPAPDPELIEPVKQTYASILRIAKGLPGSAPAPSASLNQSASLNSDCQHIPQATTYSSNLPQTAAMLPEKAYPEVIEEIGTVEEDGGHIIYADMTKSVYVRNLPTTVSAFEIEQEFSGFGQIKPGGIVVRSRKDVGICYAFVEFEDASSVQNAVEASPVQIGGRQVHIEERRPNTSSSRGRRGRGRGGYPVEVPPRGRGQFGTRYSGRVSMQEGDGSYGSRLRGNGYSSRGSRLERGVPRNYTSRNGQSLSDAF